MSVGIVDLTGDTDGDSDPPVDQVDTRSESAVDYDRTANAAPIDEATSARPSDSSSTTSMGRSEAGYQTAVRLTELAQNIPRKVPRALLTGAEAEEADEVQRTAVRRSAAYRSLHLRTGGIHAKAQDGLDACRALGVRGPVVVVGERYDAWGALLLAGLLGEQKDTPEEEGKEKKPSNRQE